MTIADADLAGNAQCCLQVITGDHLHGNAGGLTGRHSLDDLRTRWILHPLQPDETQTGAHVAVIQLLLIGVGLSDSKGQHPFTLHGHGGDGRLDQGGIQGLRVAGAVEL